MERAANIASALGAQNYPDYFGGVCTDSPDHTLYIYRIPGSQFDADLTRQATRPRLTLRFVDAQYSRTALRSLVTRIASDPYWRSKGVILSTVSPMVDGSGVEVGTPNPDSVRDEIISRYGPMVVSVIKRDVPAG